MGMMLLSALRYYEESRDSAAAELAAKFSRLVVDLTPEYRKNIGNEHSALCTASGIMRTGCLTNKFSQLLRVLLNAANHHARC
jgi:hypothetical protein